MWWLALMQIAGADGPPPSADLRLVPPPCARASGDEIVVCRARASPDRYGPRLPDAIEPAVPQADFGLFGKVRARVAGEQRSVGGFSAPAATVTMRVPF